LGGDLLSGSKNSYIATLVERQTRYVTLTKVANKDTPNRSFRADQASEDDTE
jgi:IS30 family transposase